MIPKEIRDIAIQIGQFYLNKNDGDYTATEKEIRALNITDIQADFDTQNVHITLGRPGLIIGKKGYNIELLQQHLGKKIKIYETKDQLLDWLIPYPVEYEEYDEEFCTTEQIIELDDTIP